MKIGFDGKRAVFNNTGLGNYSRLIIDLLSQEYPDNEYLIFAPSYHENPRLSPLLQRDNIHLHRPAYGLIKSLPSIWRVTAMGRDAAMNGVNLFHGLSGELPLDIHRSGIRSVVTIHDLIFRRFPDYYAAIDRNIYDYKFRKACANADRIIAISNCTKRDIMEFYDIPAHKIDVVYQGCDEIFTLEWSHSQLEQARNKYQLPDKFILYVGTIEHRKNALLILKALTLLPDDMNLVIVGGDTTYRDTLNKYIDENHLHGRVHFRSAIPFADLPAFYRLASVFAYPSRYEGFGIPMLEAITCGTPAIGAIGSCLEEAGGDASLYVHPDDHAQLAHYITLAVSDDVVRATMIEKGKEHAALFSKKSIAANTMAVYKKIII